GATGSVVELLYTRKAGLHGTIWIYGDALPSGPRELHGQPRGLFHIGAVQRRTTRVLTGLGPAREELDRQPAEDVVHHRLRHADVGIGCPAAGLETRMAELVA